LIIKSGFVENIQAIAQEYKDARGLSPLKLFIHGPPASGKSYIAKKIADHYELHYLEPEKVIFQAMEAMVIHHLLRIGKKNCPKCWTRGDRCRRGS
jgi:pantothenate kinase-related protein Tda10